MLILTFFVSQWMLAVFVQSSFHHRYASHRMFSMSPVMERVFHVLAFVSQGSSYLSARAYAILHREHHAFSDTERDPHSPWHAGNVVRMMWQTAKRYSAHFEGRSKPEPRFLGDYPDWPVFDRLASAWPTRIAWMGVYLALYLWLASAWWCFLLLPVHFLIGPAQGAIVNWCGHRYGYRNFRTNDASRNTLPLDFLTGGELFQNNHHHFSGRLNFAVRKFEIDPTYWMLRLLAACRLIRLEPAPA
ncbi:MAG TPA: acyl-CoA desaturase [Candidatus Limnocylindria bacterium]|nr:acyl-CoA desaturase [Candidatus Limnocylindria bacterium]